VVSSSAAVRSFCTLGGQFSKPLISFGNKVALGAPCFFWPGESDGSGVGQGDGVSAGVGEGVSNGCGDGETFFFRGGEGVGVGVGEALFFLGLGDAVGDGVGEVFFFTERVGDGLGFGVGVGVDFFLVATDFFFLCGVGVGVEKILFSVWPSDGSAASFTVAAKVTHVSKMRMRKSM
jgi:hypothetical protein